MCSLCPAKPFKEELQQLQQQDIITLLGLDETSKWCNSFVFMTKTTRKVRLCLDLARLNKALIRPVYRGPSLNHILPKLNKSQYLSLIDASSGHLNLKLDEKIIITHNFYMPIWQIQTPMTAIWSSSQRNYVSKNR